MPPNLKNGGGPKAQSKRHRSKRSVNKRSKTPVKVMRLNGSRPLFNLSVSAIWAALFLLLCLLSMAIGYLFDANPLVIALSIYVGSISMPIQTLVFMSLVFALEVASFSQGILVLVLLSMSIGTCLLIGARFTPYSVIRISSTATSFVTVFYHFFLQRIIPVFPQQAFGVVFTLVSEILLTPAIFILLLGVAQLKYAGEDFNVKVHHVKERKDRVAVVLIHGNAFNEAQWLFGRMYLMNQPYRDELEFFSVNVFSGPMMRHHTHGKTTKIEQCAKIAFDQILQQFKVRGKEPPQKIILVGHSLGGVVSAYIKEFLAPEYNLTMASERSKQLNIPRVIMWAAPLAGSALLHWAKTTLPPSIKFYRTDINEEFCPTNKVTIEMRQRMEETEKLNPSTYFGVTGHCDPLVRPDSALPKFMKDKNRVLIPYLGHYNIKVSLQAWSHVAEFLADYFQQEVDKVDSDSAE